MSIDRSLARPMLAPIFIDAGIDTLRNPAPRVSAGKDVALKLATKLRLPQDPELLIKVNAATQIGAGILLASGKLRRISALALIASLVPTTYAGHRFWEKTDPAEREQQRTQFFKNLGLVGGLVLELFDHRTKRRGRTKNGESRVHAMASAPIRHLHHEAASA